MFDPTIQSEDIAFERSELKKCAKCSRPNAPDRSNCIYCDDPMDGVFARSAEDSRHLEAWEKGFNVIVIGAENGEYQALPDSRVAELSEAESIAARLSSSGKTCRVVSDKTLNADELPLRISSLRFDGDSIIFVNFNTRAEYSVRSEDLVLLVSGNLVKTRTDELEKRGRKASVQTIDAVETSEDEPLIDLYVRGNARGYRINIAGFDYSSLGDSKGFLAVENIKKLAMMVKEKLPHVTVVDTYSTVKQTLDSVWEIEFREDPKGMQITGLGRRGFAKTHSSSNLRQFTLYSRLQYMCYER